MRHSRIEQEKKTVEQMIRLYCKRKEKNKQLCAECSQLLEYAHGRLTRCPFGEDKPTCRLCIVHCYNPTMKERMKKIMRYAGPRMLAYHPGTAIAHIWREYFRYRLTNRLGLPCQEHPKQ